LPISATLKEVQECLGTLRPLSIDFHTDEEGTFKGTVFVRIALVDDALQLVESGCTLDGRKIKAEVMRSTASRRVSASSLVETSQSSQIEALITQFVHSAEQECYLPSTLNAEERKLAHSLAEKHGLTHVTKCPDGSMEANKLRAVLLTKHRSSIRGSISSPSNKLSADAPVFTPLNALTKSLAPVALPSWLQEKPERQSRNSFVISDSARQQ
jgi:R3H domain